MSNRPSPYQARILRLIADGASVYWYGSNSGRAELATPGYDNPDSSVTYQRIRDDLNGTPRVPARTIDAMLRKGLLKDVQTQSEYGDWVNHKIVLTERAKRWLDHAAPDDFQSPESKPSAYSEQDLLDLLRKRHAGAEWAFFPKFMAGTGRKANRQFDAFAINLWQSKGFDRVAYEIKVYRSDFLKELKNPSKRQRAMTYSNHFYFVCPDGLVEKDEIPDDAGLMVVMEHKRYGTTLRIAKRAPRMDAPPLPMWLTVAVMRRVARLEHGQKYLDAAAKIAVPYRVMQRVIDDVKSGEATADDACRVIENIFRYDYYDIDRLVDGFLERYNNRA